MSVHMIVYSCTDCTGNKPELHQLQYCKKHGKIVRIIERVAAEWEDLASCIGFDQTRIKTIQRGAFYQPEEACIKFHQMVKWRA